MVHDLYYRYGFNEVAGNFQNYNFGKGGKENDGVTANAQGGSGYNNANFATVCLRSCRSSFTRRLLASDVS